MCILLEQQFSSLIKRAQKLTGQTYFQRLDFQLLPDTVRKYFLYCRFNGFEKFTSVEIKWKDAALKLKEGGPWKPMVFRQYNFMVEPIRLTYMKTEGLQLLPMEAIDSYICGKGNMKIKLLYLFPIANSTGKEMDQAELVTILAETIFIPHIALQHYISWEIIDAFTIKGTIIDRGVSASGIFYFNEHFQAIRFETYDRYFSGSDRNEKTKWTVLVGNYTEKNGRRYPGTFKAVWKRPQGDYEYFKGAIDSIEYNEK